MKFRIKTYTKNHEFVDQCAVQWIKATRNEFDCGLKEAKELCDVVRTAVRATEVPSRTTSVIVDTDRMPFLKWLERRAVGKKHHIANVVDESSAAKSADDILKSVAVRLIRMNEFGKAIDVLKIVI